MRHICTYLCMICDAMICMHMSYHTTYVYIPSYVNVCCSPDHQKYRTGMFSRLTWQRAVHPRRVECTILEWVIWWSESCASVSAPPCLDQASRHYDPRFQGAWSKFRSIHVYRQRTVKETLAIIVLHIEQIGILQLSDRLLKANFRTNTIFDLFQI